MSTLALKYRPKRFEDVIGQELIVKVLKRIIDEGVQYRAYLFSGVWGSGKTSLARIFAATINCSGASKPCGVCDNCRAIEGGESTNFYLEVDAATYGNIENIRKIQSFVQYVPIGAKWTVVVLDEAHQLSREAFNACLKLIEDPPTNAVFIFATTEHGRMPETIRSRCLDLRFQRISVAEIAQRLSEIAAKEGIATEASVLESIADYCQGVVRDSITMLEQLSLASNKSVTLVDINSYLGLVGVSYFKLSEAVQNADAKTKHDFVESFVSSNSDYSLFARQYLRYLRNLLCCRRGLLAHIKSEELEEYKKLTILDQKVIEMMISLIGFAKRITYDRGLVAEDFRLVVMGL